MVKDASTSDLLMKYDLVELMILPLPITFVMDTVDSSRPLKSAEAGK